MRKYNIIGLGCIAFVGKDSAFTILQKYLPVQRVAFADALKHAVKPLINEYLGIDSFTNKPEDKKIIRPILVEFGNAVRQQNHRAWIERVRLLVSNIVSNGRIAVITDVRFDSSTTDEADFVQRELGGMLVNIDRILTDGTLLKPTNASEEENYPKIKAKADAHLIAKDLVDLEKQLVEKIIPYLG